MKTKHLHLWMRGRRAMERLQAEGMRSNNCVGSCGSLVDCPALSDVVFKA
jgi:hypothetical protein